MVLRPCATVLAVTSVLLRLSVARAERVNTSSAQNAGFTLLASCKTLANTGAVSPTLDYGACYEQSDRLAGARVGGAEPWHGFVL